MAFIEGGPHHVNYSKRSMARDQVFTMSALGLERFRLAGHDRGGRVAHRLALDHPERVLRLAVLDIAPTATMYAATNRDFAEAYYHWFFLIQPFDLPERLIGAEAKYFVRKTFGSWCKRDGAITEEAMDAYIAAFTAPGAIHAACEDYRAAATIDLQHDRTDDLASHRVVAHMLVLWGSRGTVGRLFDVLACWRKKSSGLVQRHSIVDTSCPRRRRRRPSRRFCSSLPVDIELTTASGPSRPFVAGAPSRQQMGVDRACRGHEPHGEI